MSMKSRGTDAERELLRKIWSTGTYAAMRSPGSGSTTFPSPDIILGSRERKIVLECKVTKDSRKYFTKAEIAQLKEFAEKFGAEAYVAIKFLGEGWYFMSLDDLKETTKEYVASVDMVKRTGMILDELLNSS
ncbi:MAG: Holliday junction resolvase Hjc [archaeon]